jgi:hypothetical protein
MPEKKEEWFELCEQAAKEQDPEKLMALVKQINALLEEQQNRLKNPIKSALPPRFGNRGVASLQMG